MDNIFGGIAGIPESQSFQYKLVELVVSKVGNLFVLSSTPFILIAAILTVAVVDLYATQQRRHTHHICGIVAFLQSAKPLLSLSLILFGVYLLTPSTLLGLSFVDVRFIPFFLFIFLASLKIPKELDKHLITIPLLLSIFVMLHTYAAYSDAEPTLKVLLSGVNLIENNSKISPFLTQYVLWCPTNERINLRHAWAYYLVETNNSIGPKLFSYTYQPLRYTSPLPGETDIGEFLRINSLPPTANHLYCGEGNCPRWVKYYQNSNFSTLTYYDYLILVGDSCNASAYIPPEFHLYHKNNSFYLYKNSEKEK